MSHQGTKFNTSSPRYSSTRRCGNGGGSVENAFIHQGHISSASELPPVLENGFVYFIDNDLIIDGHEFYAGDVIVWKDTGWDLVESSKKRVLVGEIEINHSNDTLYETEHMSMILIDNEGNVITI